MVVGNTPETTNPVADQCEANGVPVHLLAGAVAAVVLRPRRPYPAEGYEWTYHFFWGLEDIIAVFLDMWDQVETNKEVGGLCPNDGDGKAWGDPELGLPAGRSRTPGYTLVDPGRYENGNQDFTRPDQRRSRTATCEILTGVPIPPDFTTFWKQAKQQGFTPKAASVGKALLFPESVDGAGRRRRRPVHRGVVEPEPPVLELAHRRSRPRSWPTPTRRRPASSGPSRSASPTRMFEVAVAALDRRRRASEQAADPRRRRRRLTSTPSSARSQWGAEPPCPNVAKTPLVGGQWTKIDGAPSRLRHGHRRQQGPPRHPGGGHARARSRDR